jgi:DNA-binding transcriptional regulator YdaS (Cro superfamily)
VIPVREITQDDLLTELRKRVSVTTQKAVADELGISPMYMNDLLRGRRDISERIAEKMGYRKVFRKIA